MIPQPAGLSKTFYRKYSKLDAKVKILIDSCSVIALDLSAVTLVYRLFLERRILHVGDSFDSSENEQRDAA